MPAALLSALMGTVILFVGSFIHNDLAKLLVQVVLGASVYAGAAALTRADSFTYILHTVSELRGKRG